MIRCILIALAISTVPPTLAYATDDSPIQTVELAPLFYHRFACTEHVNGELSDLGDALGSDCLVLGGMGASNGLIRLYKTNGASNEDWCGWHVEVHAPFDSVVIEVGINRITNTPGNAGQPPPGYIKFQRADGVVVVYGHLDDIRVHQGDHVGVGQVVALDGNNGPAKNPHVHIGAYSGKKPLQIRWDLAAEGRIQTLAHPQQQPHP
jgi:Peptidase family M23